MKRCGAVASWVYSYASRGLRLEAIFAAARPLGIVLICSREWNHALCREMALSKPLWEMLASKDAFDPADSSVAIDR